MESAQGPFSGMPGQTMNPMDLASAPGLPGLGSIGQFGFNGAMGADTTSLHELTTYADDLDHEQALTEAIRSSRTDMLAAVPAQHYIEDTRNSKWTVTNTSQGFSNQGTSTAYLSSAQCVDLETTRITGSLQIVVPGMPTPAEQDIVFVPTALPLMCFTYGIQIGQNGNVLQDSGTSTDQMWLIQMRLGKKGFGTQDMIYNSTKLVPGRRDGEVFDWKVEPNNYETQSGIADQTVAMTANPQTFSSTFTIKPTHPFFNIAKTWPPNIPLKLMISWNQSTSASLFRGNTTAVNQILDATPVQVYLRIHTIRSDEIYLEPSMRTYIMNHFDQGPSTNINQLALARTMNKAALFDPTFGIPAFNPANIGAIYQFETARLSSHAISGSQFQFHPVMNGSARPRLIVIGFPHPKIPYSSSLTVQGGTAAAPTPARLQTLQVLYNGQTIWDEPYSAVEDVNRNMEPLYAETMRYALVDGKLGIKKDWWNYERWAQDNAWVVVQTGQSHNEHEIQPNSSAPIEIRGSFDQPVLPGSNIRVGLFFDQTMLIQKNNSVIFSLPVY